MAMAEAAAAEKKNGGNMKGLMLRKFNVLCFLCGPVPSCIEYFGCVQFCFANNAHVTNSRPRRTCIVV